MTAVAFDFMQTPKVERTISIVPKMIPQLGSENDLVVDIKKFETTGIGADSVEGSALAALAAVLIDVDYDGSVFTYEYSFFAESIEKAKDAEKDRIRVDVSSLGQRIMIVYIDIFGNEFSEVIEVEKVRKK